MFRGDWNDNLFDDHDVAAPEGRTRAVLQGDLLLEECPDPNLQTKMHPFLRKSRRNVKLPCTGWGAVEHEMRLSTSAMLGLCSSKFRNHRGAKLFPWCCFLWGQKPPIHGHLDTDEFPNVHVYHTKMVNKSSQVSFPEGIELVWLVKMATSTVHMEVS